MHAVFVLTVLVTVAFAEEKYTTKYDNIDLDSILLNDRLLKNYQNCMLDKGPCTPDGLELKSNLPDALESECSKCSQKQKEGAAKVLKYLYEKKPDSFKELEAKYDPDGKYRAKYEELIKKKGGKA